MLHSVFKELYDQGVLIFLNTDNYVTNNIDIDIKTFVNREEFLQIYSEKVERGWIFCHSSNLNDVLRTLKEDACCSIEFGFNSDTEKKAIQVGRFLVNLLKENNFKFMAHWDEDSLKLHKVKIVITAKDLPQSVQDLIEKYEIDD